MSYIDREAVINEIHRWIGYIDEDLITRINIDISRIPDADVERVGHCVDCVYSLRLYYDGEPYLTCVNTDGLCRDVPEHGYCSMFCGAKMDEEET